jgi:nitric oxide reductase subunit C
VGQALFQQSPPGCYACHSTTPGVNLVGPSLSGIATRAAAQIGAPGYAGHATDAAGYVRESILAPNAFLVPGPTFSSGAVSMMPAGYGQSLQPAQVDALVAYLLTLK